MSVLGVSTSAAGRFGDQTPLLEVKDITLRFGGVTAINGVSFNVNRNELFAVIGPNGAGKTSIFNCLNSVYQPQQGSIKLDGVELMGTRPPFTVAQGLARTFQNIGLFTNLDVVANLMLGRHHLMMADRGGKTAKELTRGTASDSAPSWSLRLEQGGR